MKFLVIGHLCLDVIHPAEGPDIESYGGIYYTIVTLASLLEKQDTVIPVFGVHKDDHPALIDHLNQFPNIDTSGIFTFDHPTNRVQLYYRDMQSRTECSKNIAAPVPYERIHRHLSVDGILINMISGFDITLETLDHLRMAVRSHDIPIHLDIHSLTLGVNECCERYHRPLVEWRRWAFMIDTIQLNEEELASLTGGRMTEPETAGHMLTLSVKGVLVTRGERGVSLFYNDHKHVVRQDFPGIKVEVVRDTTGCGDVFGAAFQYHYARTSNLVGSAELANRIAAARVSFQGAAHLSALRHVLTPA